MLLAAGAPAVAHAEAPTPAWQFDVTGLAYAEKARTSIFEPIARITRLFADGQSLSAQVTLDAMTGASPSGAQPSSQVVTTTSAFGHHVHEFRQRDPDEAVPRFPRRLALDWVRPDRVLHAVRGRTLLARAGLPVGRAGTGRDRSISTTT